MQLEFVVGEVERVRARERDGGRRVRSSRLHLHGAE